jgi:FKBP-type peptidyl-prolyl cis-trans isomerase SlyD
MASPVHRRARPHSPLPGHPSTDLSNRSMADTAKDTVADGKVVRIHYRLTVRDQHVDDSGGEPLAYLQGGGQIVPGLEEQIAGKAQGDKFEAVVPPENAYGDRVGDPRPVPRDAFPDDVEVETGMQFAAQGPDGQVIPLWVVGVEQDQVLVDPNHPLAGETLRFEIEVVDVREATPEERTHGHAHGPGGEHD